MSAFDAKASLISALTAENRHLFQSAKKMNAFYLRPVDIDFSATSTESARDAMDLDGAASLVVRVPVPQVILHFFFRSIFIRSLTPNCLLCCRLR